MGLTWALIQARRILCGGGGSGLRRFNLPFSAFTEERRWELRSYSIAFRACPSSPWVGQAGWFYAGCFPHAMLGAKEDAAWVGV